MPAGPTYDTIATYTFPSNGNTATFSSIPQTYTDLRLVMHGQSTTSADIRIRVGNGTPDANGNYNRTLGFGYGGTPSTVAGTNVGESAITATFFSANQSTAIVEMNSYRNAIRKTFLIRNGSGNEFTYMGQQIWNSTAAINIIQITNPSHNFTAGTTFTLYGIAAA